MTAATIQHNNTAMIELYSVVDPDPSVSFDPSSFDPSSSFIRLQVFVVFRGLFTITGRVTSLSTGF